MKLQKTLLCTLIIATIGLSLPTQAFADRHRRGGHGGYHGGGHRGGGRGVGIGFGIVTGLAAGTIIGASFSNRPTYVVRSYDYCAPRTVVVTRSEPVYVRRAAVVVDDDGPGYGSAPYGYATGSGTVRSPWSNFETNIGGKSPGQVVFDTNTGQAFRIP